MRENSKRMFVDFETLMESANPVERPRGNRALSALALIGASAAVGIAVAVFATPLALVTAQATQTVIGLWDELPTELPTENPLPQHVTILDKNGDKFASIYSENRIEVPIDGISQTFIDALIATEDSRFYEHKGIDFHGLARAIVYNVLGGEKQGASTITQQLVQNILITNARDETERSVATGTSLNAKLRELKYAIALDKTMTKDEVLVMYSNAVFFGNGAYGIEAAARIYFNTSAAELTAGQSAVLVGLLKAPNTYNPVTDIKTSTDRRNTVLIRMHDEGYLDDAEFEAETSLPIVLDRGSVPSGCDDSDYPYYCALVIEEILTNEAFGNTPEERASFLYEGGVTIQTALDPKATAIAADSATSALGTGNRVAAGIAIVVPGTGHIAAVAQNRTWSQTQVVFATSKFQPGSSFKPVVLATALEQKIPIGEWIYSNGPYFPGNMDAPPRGFANSGYASPGTIDARSAIRRSVNVYFVKLIERTGVLPVVDMAHRLGIDSVPGDLQGREASLALGTYEVTPLEMANAYAVFVSGGIHCNPVAVISVTRTTSGEVLTAPDPNCHQAIGAGTAGLVADALRGTFQYGGTLSSVGALPDRPSGAKTGTTDSSAAAWTVGMTPEYATAVWVGDPRGGFSYPLNNVSAYGRTIGTVFGASIPGPIWKDVMSRLLAGKPVQGFPGTGGSLTVAPPPIDAVTERTMPDVRGLSIEVAATVLSQAGIAFEIESVTAGADDAAPNRVAAQSPESGSTLTPTTRVSLTLTRGSDTNVRAAK